MTITAGRRVGAFAAVVGAAVGLALILVCPAEARWYNNPCGWTTQYTRTAIDATSERICNPKFYFDAGEPVRPQSDRGGCSPSRTSDPDFGCGYPWAIVGSQTDDEDFTLPPAADWDYAVGSWLSGVAFLPPWGTSETWAGYGITPDEKQLLGSIVFWPEYVDYAPWGGSVQTLATCGPTTRRPGTGSAGPVVGSPSSDELGAARRATASTARLGPTPSAEGPGTTTSKAVAGATRSTAAPARTRLWAARGTTSRTAARATIASSTLRARTR